MALRFFRLVLIIATFSILGFDVVVGQIPMPPNAKFCDRPITQSRDRKVVGINGYKFKNSGQYPLTIQLYNEQGLCTTFNTWEECPYNLEGVLFGELNNREVDSYELLKRFQLFEQIDLLRKYEESINSKVKIFRVDLRTSCGKRTNSNSEYVILSYHLTFSVHEGCDDDCTPNFLKLVSHLILDECGNELHRIESFHPGNGEIIVSANYALLQYSKGNHVEPQLGIAMFDLLSGKKIGQIDSAHSGHFNFLNTNSENFVELSGRGIAFVNLEKHLLYTFPGELRDMYPDTIEPEIIFDKDRIEIMGDCYSLDEDFYKTDFENALSE